MRVTRRELLNRLALSAGAGALHSMLPLPVRAQDDTDALTGRIHADLVRHAGFGDKFSGGPGDLATASWIAGRLRDSGYRVAESEFDAPYFVKRTARLTAGNGAADLLPQAPVVATASRGVTAPLALVEAEVGDVHGRIALIVASFGRHAALFPDRGIGQTVRAAAERGAAAVVIVTTGPSGEAVALNAPEEPFVPFPRPCSRRLARGFVAAAERSEQATLVLDGDAAHRLRQEHRRARGRSPRWIAISTPRSVGSAVSASAAQGRPRFSRLASWAVRRFPEHSVFS
jgi:hypothetical protein